MPKVEDIRQALRDGTLVKAPEKPDSLVPPPKVAGRFRSPDLPKIVMSKADLATASITGHVDTVAELPDTELDGAIYLVRRDGRLYFFDADDTTWKAVKVAEEERDEDFSLELPVDVTKVGKRRANMRVLREEGSTGPITDIQLLFGRYRMKRVTELATTAEGRNYLRWMARECELAEEQVDFIAEALDPEARPVDW